MLSVFIIVDQLIRLYMWAVVLAALMSLLFSFQILNASQQLVYVIYRFLHGLTDPIVGRLRRFVPPIGGVDLSPLLVLFALHLLRLLLREYGLI